MQAGSRGPTSKSNPSYKQPAKQSNRRSSLVSNSGSVASAVPSVPIQNGHNYILVGGTGTVPESAESPQSIRPDSSLGNRTHSIPPVVVKKTRTVTQARTEARKVSRTNSKYYPAPNDNPVSGVDSQGSRPTSRVPSASRAASSAASKDADIDSLTIGMKKIKINPLTKTRRDTREQEKSRSKSPPSTASTKPLATSQNLSGDEGALQSNFPIPTLIAEVSSNSNAGAEIEPTSETSIALAPQKLSPSRFAHLQESSNSPIQLPSPSTSIVVQNNSTSTPDEVNHFFHYQPDGPVPVPVPQQEPLKWLPPNSSTPAPMKRADLPVFTPTGPIPFGSMPRGI